MQLSPRCRSIIGGGAKDPPAILLRGLLGGIAAPLYGLAVGIRNVLYDHHWLPVVKLPVPVICVGNITAGGTGKTPMVIVVCRFLQEQGRKVALLSRGYKGHGRENDEIQLLRQALPDVPIVMDGDRVRGGRKAIAEHQADIVVLDDGFQHRRLHRDLDIVLLDCTCPFGYDAIIPRGLLRESVGQLKRADVVVLTRANQVSQETLGSIRQKAEKLLQNRLADDHTGKCIATCEHKPIQLMWLHGKQHDISKLQSKKVVAFAGIGNPESFYGSLKQLGAEIVQCYTFADHHSYTSNDITYLRELADQNKADWLVTTEKDWVKLRNIPDVMNMELLHWLKIELILKDGRDAFFSALRNVIR